MSNEEQPEPCKQRFKGVENFLRRIAFNLGNSPSQTEVKIISCIPIDVTDLQQKILTLEKELHETRCPNVRRIKSKPDNYQANTESAPKYDSTIAANLTNTISNFNVRQPESSKLQSVPQCCECVSNNKKSNISFIFPSMSKPGTEQTYNFASAENSVAENGYINDNYKNIFRRRIRKKLMKDKTKNKIQLVYYAQTRTRSPKFAKKSDLVSNYNRISNTPQLHGPKNCPDDLSRSYLVDVFRKHHDPDLVVDQFSDTSNFSKPICRDNVPKKLSTKFSDVCSCCHGRFHDLDNYITSTMPNKSNSIHFSYNKDYDTNIHDMIPVKENSVNYKKDSLPKLERYTNMRARPKKIHTKYDYRYQPVIVNYEIENPVKNEIPKKEIVENYTKKREKSKRIHKQLDTIRGEEKQELVNSKSSCMDCGYIYQKPAIVPVLKQLNKDKSIATETIVTDVSKTVQCLQVDAILENKTEVTLNEIKDILQSVLAEVKTNSNVNSNTVEETYKKDAVVQKEPSQNMQKGSTILHSFKYSSFNANPYVPSCSQQLHQNPYCFHGMTVDHSNYLPHFPVFIQPAPGRYVCSCYRHSGHRTIKHATTIATNTENDIKKSGSNETEKLIKEIYKSIALNVDIPNKYISTSEYDDLKSTDFSTTTHTKDICNSEPTKVQKDKEVEVILTPLISHDTESKLVYTVLSSRMSIQNNKPADKNQSTHIDFNIPQKIEENIQTSDLDDEPYESSDGEASDTTILPDFENLRNKKERSGFFQKMFKSVKLFKKKKDIKQFEEEDEEERGDVSDSDDYETVYSEKINKPPVHVKFRPKNVIQFSKPPKNAHFAKTKRTPYMEQEYRRRWNENLMFNGERNVRRPICETKTAEHPAFWQEYETRSAFTKPQYQTSDKVNQETDMNVQADKTNLKDRLAWLKKHKMGINCGDQWKRFILES